MKRVVAIGSLDTFSHLLMGCFGTLSKYAKHGDETCLIVTIDPGHEQAAKSRRESIQRAARCINAKVQFVEGFNHTAVSQSNVTLLRSFIEPIGPSLAFIPFRKAVNSRQSILGSSGFLACRWITNILLYEVDANTNFAPTVFSSLSEDEHNAKLKAIQEFSGDENDWHVEKIKKSWINSKHQEAFESHRLVLLATNDVI